MSPNFGRRSREPENLKTLETLAKAASDWCLIKKQLNHAKGAEIFRKFTEGVPLLAFTLRNNLSRGTLRFRVEEEKHTGRPKSHSYLEYEVIHNSYKIIIYRKTLFRKSEVRKTIFLSIQGQKCKGYKNTIITEKTRLSGKPHFNKSFHLCVYGKRTREDNFEAGEDFAPNGGNVSVQFIGWSFFIPKWVTEEEATEVSSEF